MPDFKHIYLCRRLALSCDGLETEKREILKMGKKKIPLIYNPTAGALKRDAERSSD